MNINIQQKEKSLRLHCECVCAWRKMCRGWSGGWGWGDQNKCHLPWSRDSLDFRNVAPQGRESAPSEGRGQNQIVPYGCLLLLLSWIHTQCRHYVMRIGIRRAAMRQSRISEHESLTSFFLLGTWTMLTAIQMTDQVILDWLILHSCYILLFTGNQHHKRGLIWQTSYLPCPANPFPDTEVHKDPGDGQRDRQWHSKLAWFFQAIGHFMHVAPASQSEQQGRLLYTQGHKHAAEEAVLYVSQGCMQDTLKLCCFESKRNQSISYSQNSTTALVRLVVSIMEWFV